MHAQTDSEILAQEQRLTEATRNLDVAAMDRIYADDVMFTGVTGVICDKPALLGEARRGIAERQAATASPASAAVVAYDKDEIRTIRYGDSAVASFRFSVTIRGDGKEVTRRYRTTNVWLKRLDTWQVVAAHTATLG